MSILLQPFLKDDRACFLSISKSSCISSELAKKRKEKQKNLIQQKLYLSRLLSSFSCLALNASHSFLHFEEAVGFHPFFASYFVLHNRYIRILAIHRYKSSWRCSISTTSPLLSHQSNKVLSKYFFYYYFFNYKPIVIKKMLQEYFRSLDASISIIILTNSSTYSCYMHVLEIEVLKCSQRTMHILF